MPKGLVFRLLVLLVVAVLASLYFRREAGVPAAGTSAQPAPAADPQPQRDEPGASATSPAAPTPPPAPRGERLGPCDVTHVTDGDTLNVRCGSRKERVRMLQIDTPEREQPLYAEARDALGALIGERGVELELGAEERDDHGRLLAYVFAGGENLNLAMIREGWSPYFDRYGAGAYPREFADAERAARVACLGIWRSSCRSGSDPD